ncbi:hypothetical protein JB92DRAFT_3104317 [Gautieria morchelliformis]|nr:hypothetical protein JB92DRAFT_3104317 [Gautieria morchelliformis]
MPINRTMPRQSMHTQPRNFAQPLNRDMSIQSNMGASLSHPLARPITGDLQGPPKSRGKHADRHISQKGQDMWEQLEASRLRREKLANTQQRKEHQQDVTKDP